MFQTAPKAESALLHIGEGLFRELQAFGRMSGTLEQPPGDPKGYLRDRALPTWKVLSALEALADLRFDIPIPHSYAFGRWPASAPVGGYTGSSAEPRPSEVVRAMVDHWDALASGLTTDLRLLRSALYVAHRTDLPHAVEFLLALHGAGAAPQEASLLRVLKTLLVARAAVASDEDLVPFLLQGPAPEEPGGWQDALSSLPEQSVPYETAPLPKACSSMLEAALSHAVREVVQVRESCDFDTWYEQRLNLRGLLFVVRRLVSDAHGAPPISIQAIVSQLEEIEMDGEALRLTSLMKPFAVNDPPSYRRDLSYAREEVGRGYREAFGQEWAERLFHERLLVPAALGPAVLNADAPELPTEWGGLSRRLAHPFIALFRPGLSPHLYRATRFETTQLAGLDEVQRFFKRAGLAAEAAQVLIDREYRGARSNQSLPDIDRENLRRVLQGAHTLLCGVEMHAILSDVANRSAQGDARGALDRIEYGLALYPWNSELYFAQALAHSELRDWAAAREDLVEALVLSPTLALGWQHLRIVLAALGREDESELASQMALLCT